MRARGLALLLATAAGLGLAGCGDDDDGGATAEGLGAEARRQATAICGDTAPKAGRVLGAKSIADAERYGKDAREVIAELRRRLGEIDPGDGAVQRWRRWLDAIEADIRYYRLLELAGSVQNREAVLEQNEQLAAARPARVARRLGLPDCADVTNDAANTFDR